ncbi:MAG: S41 family peptidase, partial [Anaerolineae bacterium]|nr:S41 family peptidase [Anaerolineae bacterium]
QLMNTDLQGHFEGIGATVRQDADTGRLVIVGTMSDSPAEQAGMLSGDAIVSVDGADVTTLSQGEIVSLIRGPEGTDVELGVLREGAEEMLTFVVTRADIEVPSVEAEILEEGVAYIRLYQFGSDTARDLQETLRSLDAETLPGLILDLRGNPGGYLSTAVDVASEFLDSGVVVIERLRDDETIYEATGNASAPTVPLVVLVDEGSASASELVAGAFQDQERAVIIGTQTFGKGSVQTWRGLANGGGVRVTTARWFTPGERTIDGVGLMPDLVVPFEEADLLRDTQLQAGLDFLLQELTVAQP